MKSRIPQQVLLCALVSCAMSILLWQYTLAVEKNGINNNTRAITETFGMDAEAYVENISTNLNTLTERLSKLGNLNAEFIDFEAELFLESTPAMASFAWIDADYVIQSMSPKTVASDWIGTSVAIPGFTDYFEKVRLAGRELNLDTFDAGREIRMGLHAPIHAGTEFKGFVGGEFSAQKFFNNLHKGYQNVHIIVSAPQGEIFRQDGINFDSSHQFYFATEVQVGDALFSLQAIPSAATLAVAETKLPTTVLIVSLLVSTLLTWTQYQKSVIERSSQTLKRQSAALNQTKDAMFIRDKKHRIVDVNAAALEMFGYSRDELVGKNILELADDSVDLEAMDPVWQEKIRTNSAYTQRMPGRTKDGKLIYASVSDSLLKNDAGEKIGVVSMIRDVTQQHELEEQLRHSERLKSLGQITGGVAHDFNNLLCIISNTASIFKLKGKGISEEEIERNSQRIITAVKRGASLTDQLLSYSRKQRLSPAVIKTREFFDELEHVLRPALGETIHLDMQSDAEVWAVHADENQLTNAVLNLVLNGRDAMPNGGTIKISAINKTFDSNSEQPFEFDVAPGEYVCIEVSDNGTGMSPASMAKAFEPFYTTKDVGQGSGLGLSMVYGFAEQSGGSTSIHSVENSGTTVTICLPAVTALEPASSTDSDSLYQAAPDKQTLLIVEDNADLMEVTEEIVQSLGYNTLTAGDANQALEQAQNALFLDGALLDIVLPGDMNGVELSDALRDLQPDLKICFMTGYAAEDIVADLSATKHEGLFNKPINVQDLAELLSELFSTNPPHHDVPSTLGNVVALETAPGNRQNNKGAS